MTQQEIDRAAVDSFVFENGIFNPELPPYYEQGFKDGANWRINSVWHTMDEAQDGKRPYIVQYNEEWKFAMFTKPISIPKEQAKSVFKRWAYMDALIPDTED